MGKKPVNGGINPENAYSLCQRWIKGYHAQIYPLSIEIGGGSMLSYTARFWMGQKIIKTSRNHEYDTKMLKGNLTLPW